MCLIFVVLISCVSCVSGGSIFGVIGQKVTLECGFHHPNVKYCYWHHNGDTLEYNPKHPYKIQRHYPNIDFGEDCSISIRNLTNNDDGNWKCSQINHFGVLNLTPIGHVSH